MNKLFILLCLFVSSALNAQGCVEVLEAKREALKRIGTIREAGLQVAQIRQTLSLRPCDRDATHQEQEAIIKTIVTTETAAMLVDGAYDFKFNDTAYRLPSGSLNEREKVHYGYIFCLTQTTHLLVENPLFIQEDIALLLRRRACSRHVPTWIKDIFESNLSQVNWEVYVKPYISLANFALKETRLQERIIDQETRKNFSVTLTGGQIKEVEQFHTRKRSQFDQSATLKPSTFKVDLFAISTATYQCTYYACQGPYGHYAARDFGKDIVDNFDSDPQLKALVRRSVTGDMRLSPDFLEEESLPYTFRSIARNFLKQKLGKKFQDIAQKFTDLDKNKRSQLYKQDPSGKKYDEAQSEIIKEFDEVIEDSILKQLVEKETSANTTTSFVPFIIAYPDIISYLYGLNIYNFQKESASVLKINPYGCSVLHSTGRNIYIYSSGRHASQLISAENTVENLVAYIKAKEHENRYRVNANTSYISSWC